MYPRTENEVSMSTPSKVRTRIGQTNLQTDETENVLAPHSRTVVNCYCHYYISIASAFHYGKGFQPFCTCVSIWQSNGLVCALILKMCINFVFCLHNLNMSIYTHAHYMLVQNLLTV